MGAGRWRVVRSIVLPSSFSSILLGLKMALPYGVVGAVVAEIIASNRGLGYLLNDSAHKFNTAGLFAVVLVLVAVTTAINFIILTVDHRVNRWRAEPV
jgi:NitT/TauT family transport system permease protein